MRPLIDMVGLVPCVIKRALDVLNCAGCRSSGKEVYTRDLAQQRPASIRCQTQVWRVGVGDGADGEASVGVLGQARERGCLRAR